MDKNSKPPQQQPIQFTKLTPDDITRQNDSYKRLLAWGSDLDGEKGIKLYLAMETFYQTFK